MAAATGNPPTATATATFTHPPLFGFPPFFTLQANSLTRSTQLKHWSALILNWCAATRTFHLDADRDEPSDLWSNPRISRRLDRSSRAAVLAHMVAASQAAWDPQQQIAAGRGRSSASSASSPPPSKALIFFRKPEEWGDLIYQWVTDTGQSTGILTFFELTEGDLVQGQEFAGLPEDLLRLALNTLVAKGKAQVFAGSSSGGGGGGGASQGSQGLQGVKFA
ncbi:unnamed protein product [Parajaminaea phylloscopi]